MNARILGVLIILLAVLGGGALLVRQQTASQPPADTVKLGQPLLKDLQAAAVAAIVIRQPKGSLTIAKQGERWTIAERDGFPADFDKVRDFVIKAISLKVGQSETLSEQDRTRLNLDGSGTAVEFLGADAKLLARIALGRKYFKVQPDNPDQAKGDGRYVALPDDPQRALVVADPLAQASALSADWVSKSAIAADKVKSLEVRHAGGGVWKIERSADNADWKLAGAQASEKLDVSKANIAAYTFTKLELADVAPKGTKAEDSGLAEPTVVTATTLDGVTYAVKVGKIEGENYYATIAVAGEPKPEGKDAAERLKAIRERLPREQALAGYTLLIPKFKLEDVLKKRAELLAAKEPAKK